MSFKLGDIYIGSFGIGQGFGVRPDVYQARFGLRGHNGIDVFCRSLTIVLAAADGVVLDAGFSEGGYGNFIKILHDGYYTLYAHLNDLALKKGDKVIAGALIGHSNNTGLSDTPHLHFGVAPCDGTGARTEPDNGFGGYIDPMSSLCVWDVLGLKEPSSVQVEDSPPIPVDIEELQTIRTQATNFESVYNYIKQYDKEEVLTDVPTNIPGAGQKVNSIIAALIKNLPLRQSEQERETPAKKGLWQKVRGFIIKQNT